MGIQPKDKPVVITADNYTNKRVFKYSFVNPKILGLLTVVLLMVVGVGTGVYLTQQPNTTQTHASLQVSEISFRPSELETAEDSNFSIDVYGNAFDNQITSVQLGITYDPEFLELTSVTPKQFLPRVLTAPTIASGSASVSLGTDGNSGITGAGIIASLSFKAKQITAATQVRFETSQTKMNILGNTTSPLGELKSATIRISPAESTDPSPSPSSSPLTSTSASPSPSASTQSQASPLSSPSPSPQTLNLDFNSDSSVNAVDLSIIYSAWGTPSTELQKKADLNSDGVVNGIDYATFLPHFNRN